MVRSLLLKPPPEKPKQKNQRFSNQGCNHAYKKSGFSAQIINLQVVNYTFSIINPADYFYKINKKYRRGRSVWGHVYVGARLCRGRSIWGHVYVGAGLCRGHVFVGVRLCRGRSV